MRVLIISWEYPPYIEGGLGRHVAELAPALVSQGVEVGVVTPAPDSLISQHPSSSFHGPADGITAVRPVPRATVTVEDGVTIHRVYVSNDSQTDIYSQATEVNRALQAYVSQANGRHRPWDIIHVHDWLTGFASIGLKDAQDYPLVATIHATERGRWRGNINDALASSIDQAERQLIDRSDGVIVCSQYMLTELQLFFQTPTEKLTVVPNGVDIKDLFSESNQDLEAFRATYADPHEQIVFTVSRLVYEKGAHVLIEAAPRILEKCPLARIIIAGRGPEAENLKNQAQTLGVSDRVDLIGFISDEDRDRLYKVANCAIFPSLYEPFGIVALEAMALGCPVVVSEVGGLVEVVTHNETGITIYSGDAESAAWGVVRALTHPEWSQKHAVRARHWVEESFNWPRIASLTKDAYQHFLDDAADA